MFTKYFGDSATAKLAENGYAYTAEDYASDNASSGNAGTYPVMGETLEKGIFSAKVLGIAGDTQDPMVLIDIKVNALEAAAASDIIGVYTQAIGTGEFEENRGKYGLVYSKGVRDEEDQTLYHVSTRVPPKWMTNGEEVTFDIVSIHMRGENESGNDWKGYFVQELDDFGIDASEVNSRLKVHNVDMQFRFTLPENVLKESVENDYDELAFEVNGKTYRLHYAEFGAHKTIIRFDYVDAGYNYDVNLAADMKAAEQFALTVDGVRYTPDIGQTGSFIDDQGNCNLGIKDMCYMSLYFQAIDYENAQSIKLEANGVSSEIKK